MSAIYLRMRIYRRHHIASREAEAREVWVRETW